MADAMEAVIPETDDYSQTTDRWYSGMLDKVANRPASYPSFRVENSWLYKYGKNSLSELRKESDYWKLVVSQDLVILKRHHEIPASGHVGIFKTYWKIRHRYFWPKMQADVVKFVKGCVTCARYKTECKAPPGLMGGKPSITAPWQLGSLDFIGLFPRSTQGYTHVLVVTDHFTKYVVLFAVRAGSAKTITRCVEEGIFLVYGTPKYLICDNGTRIVLLKRF
ncbi:hypothetical protein Zmor_028458 [Zophobas morio]|uniref:Integrase catalytic domain-containing protein n=1 Tax=Zophobas morio TaxID=2755281 RepID=A0AA38M336_9CUCU|nr:hypothetical protein Zmor_028458 [Zophobas morio]